MNTSMLHAAVSLCFALSSGEEAPYAGQQDRQIKSLSEQQIAGYEAGRGMGFAKVAELNHYPGPKHVLELATDMSLTREQREQVVSAYNVMHEQTVALGKELVQQERELDMLFAGGDAGDEAVRAFIAEIARIEGEIRFAHVRAHLVTRQILDTSQIETYDRLRGYR